MNVSRWPSNPARISFFSRLSLRRASLAPARDARFSVRLRGPGRRRRARPLFESAAQARRRAGGAPGLLGGLLVALVRLALAPGARLLGLGLGLLLQRPAAGAPRSARAGQPPARAASRRRGAPTWTGAWGRPGRAARRRAPARPSSPPPRPAPAAARARVSARAGCLPGDGAGHASGAAKAAGPAGRPTRPSTVPSSAFCCSCLRCAASSSSALPSFLRRALWCGSARRRRTALGRPPRPAAGRRSAGLRDRGRAQAGARRRPARRG